MARAIGLLLRTREALLPGLLQHGRYACTGSFRYACTASLRYSFFQMQIQLLSDTASLRYSFFEIHLHSCFQKARCLVVVPCCPEYHAQIHHANGTLRFRLQGGDLYVCVCVRVCVCVCVCVCVYDVCVYVCMYIHTYIHTHIHTYTHTYMHTYIHTYIHTVFLARQKTFSWPRRNRCGNARSSTSTTLKCGRRSQSYATLTPTKVDKSGHIHRYTDTQIHRYTDTQILA